MSKPTEIPSDVLAGEAAEAPAAPARLARETVIRVRDACLCLHAQRAARALARRFDRALRPAGMTNGQFSLMMVLSGPEPKPPGRVAEFLAMDRTSLTAMVKPLQRRGWIEVRVDEKDRRGRLLILTEAGRAALARAVPIWQHEHAAVEAELVGADALRAGLNALAFGGPDAAAGGAGQDGPSGAGAVPAVTSG